MLLALERQVISRGGRWPLDVANRKFLFFEKGMQATLATV